MQSISSKLCGCSYINNSCFNQFQNTMNYIDSTQIMENAKYHAQCKLIDYLSNTLRISRIKVSNKILDSLRTTA